MKIEAKNTNCNLHCEKMSLLNRIRFVFSIAWRLIFLKGACLMDVDVVANGTPVETEPA